MFSFKFKNDFTACIDNSRHQNFVVANQENIFKYVCADKMFVSGGDRPQNHRLNEYFRFL